MHDSPGLTHRSTELEQPEPGLLSWPRVVAVDPGLQGTGLAVWDRGTLVHAAVLTVPNSMRNAPWPARADSIAEQVQDAVPKNFGSCVLCEMMEYFGGGMKGIGWRSGDLQKTMYLVGLISGRVSPARFVPVPVHQWKGQLPKRVVEDRLRARLGVKTVKFINPQLHAWDAIGIGMWAMGLF